jgi:hypothetical protein
MVMVRVSSGSWPIQFDEFNMMFLEVQIGNSLCAFHLIHTILEVTNNFPSTLQNSTTNKLAVLIAKVPSNLPVLFISIPPTHVLLGTIT